MRVSPSDPLRSPTIFFAPPPLWGTAQIAQFLADEDVPFVHGLVGDAQFGRLYMSPRKIPILAIGALDIHCTDCAVRTIAQHDVFFVLPFTVQRHSQRDNTPPSSLYFSESPDPLQPV